jgi:hypothetical protein
MFGWIPQERAMAGTMQALGGVGISPAIFSLTKQESRDGGKRGNSPVVVAMESTAVMGLSQIRAAVTIVQTIWRIRIFIC